MTSTPEPSFQNSIFAPAVGAPVAQPVNRLCTTPAGIHRFPIGGTRCTVCGFAPDTRTPAEVVADLMPQETQTEPQAAMDEFTEIYRVVTDGCGTFIAFEANGSELARVRIADESDAAHGVALRTLTRLAWAELGRRYN